ncbi:putative 40S ribosomal protein S27-1 [Monocercomonoides exilis]|uniref:putative 40S ribosomal protein S27-1 n=1 Tax=Monocercomonoides exilis TaxID=2049356 RepID=UPI0035598AC3|nr:putative 40S ribosomal protein S27-1 [Monocercomonoides exilis]|eukprot:MONOS_2596.1-p1 / transcript=MONOS_2596.1 / gene=MONOS_2596 / organism=Monocercomonoides_exilis_PA203 / gene_product=40S ribosomal protein S27-1 / transcript_product=40S ribosomal protein S27-1 / location=Mono_scaffold00054:131606-132020(+) / protein_length=90 / sequence_SO=supercontig / SO=protein_coding / is_pseudo=false
MVKKFMFKVDLLHPGKDVERSKYKLKRLVQSPNSYFLDVKCRQCNKMITVFSHSSTTIYCGKCGQLILVPTGGKSRLATGVKFRRKSII